MLKIVIIIFINPTLWERTFLSKIKRQKYPLKFECVPKSAFYNLKKIKIIAYFNMFSGLSKIQMPFSSAFHFRIKLAVRC